MNDRRRIFIGNIKGNLNQKLFFFRFEMDLYSGLYRRRFVYVVYGGKSLTAIYFYALFLFFYKKIEINTYNKKSPSCFVTLNVSKHHISVKLYDTVNGKHCKHAS